MLQMLIEAAARVLRPPRMQVVEHIGVRMHRWLSAQMRVIGR